MVVETFYKSLRNSKSTPVISNFLEVNLHMNMHVCSESRTPDICNMQTPKPDKLSECPPNSSEILGVVYLNDSNSGTFGILKLKYFKYLYVYILTL